VSSKTLQTAALILSIAPGFTLFGQAQPRVAGSVNESAIVRLRGTTHPLATPASEIGRAPAGLRLERILLEGASNVHPRH